MWYINKNKIKCSVGHAQGSQQCRQLMNSPHTPGPPPPPTRVATYGKQVGGSHNPRSSTGGGGIFSHLGGMLVRISPATRRPSPWGLDGKLYETPKAGRKMKQRCSCKRTDTRQCADFTEEEREMIYNDIWKI